MFFLNIDETFKNANSTYEGLSNDEAAHRLNSFGKNVLTEKKSPGIVIRFLSQFANVMVLVLLFSAVLSISLAISSKEYSELFEGFAILLIVFVNATIGVVQERKAELCLKNLKKTDTTTSKVLRNGVIVVIASSELVVGDIVILNAGDLVPADLRLFESTNFRCDESMLTGESHAVDKNAKLIMPKTTSINEQKNMAFSGTLAVNGKAKGIVVRTGDSTEIGKIATLIINSNKDLTPLQKNIKKVGYVITICVLIICAIIFLIEILFSKQMNIVSALLSSVALAVAAIPESLPAVITIILALGVQQLSKRKVIIKHLHAVETLGSCEIICSDKTGTLTQNKMTVTEFYSGSSFSQNNSKEFELMMQCIYQCTEIKVNNGELIGEPTEAAIYEYAMKNAVKQHAKQIYELPFDSHRKMMSVVVSMGSLKSFTKGAFDRVIESCSHALIDDKKTLLTAEIKTKLISANDYMTNQALRVIAFCYKDLDEFNSEDNVETDMTFIGMVGMSDPPRKEVYEAIQNCFKAGLKPVMITGDHKNTAFAIAKQLNIAVSESEVITGDQLNSMSMQEINASIHKYTVFARVSPEHKVMIVKAFKNAKKVVAMTGDGVNDAPSLRIADIGVGMGQSGTDVVKSVSDLLIGDDNFASIVVAIEEGRKVYSNIQKTLQFLLSTNVVEVLGMLFALIFFPQHTFLVPSQILFINLATDSLPAFALGVEKAEKQVMQMPPRKNNNIFAGDVGFAIIYQSIIQMFIVCGVYLFAMKTFSPEIATTMTFYVIIYMQLLHSINVKSNKSLFDINIFNNKTFNICFIVTMILNLSVSIFPVFHKVLSLSPLTLRQWMIVIVASVFVIPMVEIVKLFTNKTPVKKPKKSAVQLNK